MWITFPSAVWSADGTDLCHLLLLTLLPLTIYNDLNIFEVDLPTSQDAALTAVRPFICFLDSPDLQVVVGQHYKPN